MPLDLFLLAQKTRSPTDIERWQLAEMGNVQQAACAELPRRLWGMVAEDAISAAMLALVLKTTTILEKHFESESALQAYLRRLVAHVAAEEVDELRTVAAFGPALKTKLRRLAKGHAAMKPIDPQARMAAGINSPTCERFSSRYLIEHRDPIAAAERWWWFTWAAEQAYALASDDPVLTKAMKLAEGEDHHFESGLPSITAIAAAVGLKRETLRDRFRRLGRQLAALDPEGGVEYLGKVWEAAARNAGSDFRYVEGQRDAA